MPLDNTDAFDVLLSDDEIKALELPYQSDEPEAVEVKTVEKAPAKAEMRAEKNDDDDAAKLRQRVIDAERRVAEERQKRMEAEKQAHERATTLTISDARIAEAEFHTVSNALARETGLVEALKSQHTAAMDAGDYKQATDIASKLAKAEAKIVNLEDGQSQLKDRFEQLKGKAKEAVDRPAPKTEPADPFEAFVAGQPDPKVQSWLRANPQFARPNNEKNWYRVVAAHNSALADGIDPHSNNYIPAIEKSLGLSKEIDVDAGDDDGEVAETVVKKSAPKPQAPKRVSAPVARDSVLQRRADGKPVFKLTREQAETADELGIPRERYAKRLYEAEQSGMLGRYNNH